MNREPMWLLKAARTVGFGLRNGATALCCRDRSVGAWIRLR